MTLARYLHHRRWIWNLKRIRNLGSHKREVLEFEQEENIRFVSKVLTSLTKLRLKEGFHFAHSVNGIQSLILEVPVSSRSEPETVNDGKSEQTLLIQYVIFPPNREIIFDSDSEEDSDEENDSDSGSEAGSSNVSDENDPDKSDEYVKMVTEVWIEPQDGVILRDFKEFDQMRFSEVPAAIFDSDKSIIEMMTTLEYILSLCDLGDDQIERIGNPNLPFDDGSIRSIPFNRNLVSLLDKSPQIEFLFSSFIQEFRFPEMNPDMDRPNFRLLESFHSELQDLHDTELTLSKSEMQEIFGQIIREDRRKLAFTNPNADTAWKCYVKQLPGEQSGFFLTFAPTNFKDLKSLVMPSNQSINDVSSSATALVKIKKPMPLKKLPKQVSNQPPRPPSSEKLSMRKRTMSDAAGKRRRSVATSKPSGNNLSLYKGFFQLPCLSFCYRCRRSRKSDECDGTIETTNPNIFVQSQDEKQVRNVYIEQQRSVNRATKRNGQTYSRSIHRIVDWIISYSCLYICLQRKGIVESFDSKCSC